MARKQAPSAQKVYETFMQYKRGFSDVVLPFAKVIDAVSEQYPNDFQPQEYSKINEDALAIREDLRQVGRKMYGLMTNDATGKDLAVIYAKARNYDEKGLGAVPNAQQIIEEVDAAYSDLADAILENTYIIGDDNSLALPESAQKLTDLIEKEQKWLTDNKPSLPPLDSLTVAVKPEATKPTGQMNIGY